MPNSSSAPRRTASGSLARSSSRQSIPLASEVLRLVQLARPAGALLHLCFTPRIAAIPGLVARLSGLRDCVMVELAHGAAATGALLAANAILRPADAIALVHRLPLVAARCTGR